MSAYLTDVIGLSRAAILPIHYARIVFVPPRGRMRVSWIRGHSGHSCSADIWGNISYATVRVSKRFAGGHGTVLGKLGELRTL
jgi:hypothetical protein